MDFPHGETVTLVSTTTTDDGLGNTTTETTETTWGPCAVAPRYSQESNDPRVPPVIVGKTIYGPAVAIDSDDTLVIGGETYEVDGLPGEWVNPFTGWAPGIEVPVKRTATV
jgi:hypothetical protein